MESATRSAPPVTAAARHHLKSSTNNLHEQLHALPAFVSLLDNTLDVPGYVAIMRRFQGFYAKLDAEVLRACNDYNVPEQLYHYQPREPMFAADVRALGCGDHGIVDGRCTVPDIHSVASLAGVAYVIDGSVLGGMAMNKSAAVLLGEDVISGRSYWNWCRKNGLRQWHAALSLVDHCWTVEESRATMTDAATQTFEALNVWLSADRENSGAIGP
jgi:heme oxygenase